MFMLSLHCKDNQIGRNRQIKTMNFLKWQYLVLASRDGYPLSYSIFNGSQYEGYTMIPIIDDFVSRFSLTDFVIVADSGLMSAKNITVLYYYD